MIDNDDRPARRPGEVSSEGADSSKPSAVAAQAAFTSDSSFNEIYKKARSSTGADSLHPLSLEDNQNTAQTDRINREIQRASSQDSGGLPTPSGALNDASPSRLGAHEGSMLAQAEAPAANEPLPYSRVWDLARANYRGADEGLTRVNSNYTFHAAKWPVDDPRHELMNKLNAAQTKFGSSTGGDLRREDGWARTHPEEVNKDSPVPSDALQTKAALIQIHTEKYRDAKKEPTAKEMQQLLDILEGRKR